MGWTARWARRLLRLMRRDAVERAMDDELRDHLARETAERIRSGMSPDAARLSALRDFGGIEAIKEDARDAHGVRLVEDLVADARYAVRVLRRNPGLTATAVLTFALGIGATTAIFSAVYGVLLRPLPYRDPGRLVVVWERNVPRNADRNVVAADNFQAWRNRTQMFEGLAALVPRRVTLVGGAAPERIAGAEVSPGYFHLLGVVPALGRDFAPADETPGAGVVILSHAFWTRNYGADPAVVGRPLRLADRSYTIVGVMPAGFEPPQFGWLGSQELWFPFVITPTNRAWGRFLLVVARLKPTVSLDGARSAMALLGERLASEVPGDQGWTVSLVPLPAQITGDVRAAFLVLLGAVALLLLIAATNVATLTLSWMQRRGHEFAIRRALGATSTRLFRQLFTQSAVLGLVGSVVGLLAAVPGVRLLVSLVPPETPRVESIRLDAPVLFVATAIAVFATLVFGTVAARQNRSASRLRPTDDDDRQMSLRTRGGFVAAEIAVALALSVMAMLMVRSFASLRAVGLGFAADGVVAARIALPGDRYQSPASQRIFFNTLLERVRVLPGVQSASLMSTRPFSGLGPATEVSDPLYPPSATTHSTVADIRYIDPALFKTLRIPVEQGTLFDAQEPPLAPLRVIVSESLAQTLWPDQKAVGRKVHLDLFDGITGDVVGVVADVHLMDARTPPRPAAYLSDIRFPSEVRDLVVRVNGDPESIVPALRQVLATLEPNTPLYQVASLPSIVDRSLAADRFTTVMLSVFAAVALVLCGVGVFGVAASDVARQRKEIGIRMALGARASTVVFITLRQAMRRAATGLLAGTAIALALTLSMRSLLFGIPPTDPMSFLTVAFIVLGCVTVATLIPSVQAVRSSPLGALRQG